MSRDPSDIGSAFDEAHYRLTAQKIVTQAVEMSFAQRKPLQVTVLAVFFLVEQQDKLTKREAEAVKEKLRILDIM